MISLVGNDVVDLRDPESQPEAIHPRWDSRVFTPEELDRITEAPSAHCARWKMWAAKESAFKVAKKLEPELPFFPTAFAVQFDGVSGAYVRHVVGRFAVQLQVTSELVHAVTTPIGSSPALSRLVTLRTGPEATVPASGQVRDLACDAIGAVLAVDPSDIEVSTASGVPVASSAGTSLPVDLSLSHHGRFVACAWVAGTPASQVGLIHS